MSFPDAVDGVPVPSLLSPIRGLSLTQPWAALVALGAKSIETRSWPTSYRGQVAIHASKGFPPWARAYVPMEPFATALAGAPAEALPLGAIVALARVAACWEIVAVDRPGRVCTRAAGQVTLNSWEYSFGNYALGRWGWVLADVIALPAPIPCRGALGLWDLPPAVLASLQAVLAVPHG